MSVHETTTLLGTTIDKMDMADVIAASDESIQTRNPILIGVVNAAKLIKARHDVRLRESLAEATFIVADGAPVVWLSVLCGDRLPGRVAGIDIMSELLTLADRRKYGVFFLGATQDVVERVVEHVRRAYPSARIAGYHDGYFSGEQEQALAETIRDSRADILLVAMPTPKKENFLSKWRQTMGVPVCHGVGGSFDVVAGITKRAPLWMQRCGLEWFYRVMQEPGRMWKRYLVTNSIFVWLSAGEILRHRLRHVRPRADEPSHEAKDVPVVAQQGPKQQRRNSTCRKCS